MKDNTTRNIREAYITKTGLKTIEFILRFNFEMYLAACILIKKTKDIIDELEEMKDRFIEEALRITVKKVKCTMRIMKLS